MPVVQIPVCALRVAHGCPICTLRSLFDLSVRLLACGSARASVLLLHTRRGRLSLAALGGRPSGRTAVQASVAASRSGGRPPVLLLVSSHLFRLALRRWRRHLGLRERRPSSSVVLGLSRRGRTLVPRRLAKRRVNHLSALFLGVSTWFERRLLSFLQRFRLRDEAGLFQHLDVVERPKGLTVDHRCLVSSASVPARTCTTL